MAGPDYGAGSYWNGFELTPSEHGSAGGTDHRAPAGALGSGTLRLTLEKTAQVTVWHRDEPGRLIEPVKAISAQDTAIAGYWTERAKLDIEGHRIEIVFATERVANDETGSFDEGLETVIAKLTQPDGTVWTGWSGYTPDEGSRAHHRGAMETMVG